MKPIIEALYHSFKYILIILYIIGIFGLWNSAPKYLTLIDGLFNIFIATILLYFFNPYSKVICNEFHKKVVFSAGIAILLQTSLMQSLIVKKLTL